MTDEHAKPDEESKKAILENIKKYGCHLVSIEADNYLPAFVYSIGLYKNFRHPEIICFGLKNDVMGFLLNHACDLIKNGETLTTDKFYSGFLQDYAIQFLDVDKAYYPDYFGYAGWFYNMSFDFPVLQLVWSDKQQKFPWEADFNPDWKFRQPLLDRNIDFKFYEERNLGVYTTKQVLQGEPILYAYHNDDGDWQFHSSAEPKVEDAKLICLEEIIKLDPSLNEIYHLQYGWAAYRGSKDDGWKYEQLNEDSTWSLLF